MSPCTRGKVKSPTTSTHLWWHVKASHHRHILPSDIHSIPSFCKVPPAVHLLTLSTSHRPPPVPLRLAIARPCCRNCTAAAAAAAMHSHLTPSTPTTHTSAPWAQPHAVRSLPSSPPRPPPPTNHLLHSVLPWGSSEGMPAPPPRTALPSRHSAGRARMTQHSVCRHSTAHPTPGPADCFEPGSLFITLVATAAVFTISTVPLLHSRTLRQRLCQGVAPTRHPARAGRHNQNSAVCRYSH